jgi:hypothetical protein
MAQPFIITSSTLPVETDAVLREMAEVCGMAPASFVRAALEEISETEAGIPPEHAPAIARIRAKAWTRRNGAEASVPSRFNLLPSTDAALRAMAIAHGDCYTDFLRLSLEVFTATGRGSRERTRASSKLRQEVSARLAKYDAPTMVEPPTLREKIVAGVVDTVENYRRERRQKRR